MSGAAAGTENAAIVASVCIASVASSGQIGEARDGSAARPSRVEGALRAVVPP
jgi:hypothetical protein